MQNILSVSFCGVRDFISSRYLTVMMIMMIIMMTMMLMMIIGLSGYPTTPIGCFQRANLTSGSPSVAPIDIRLTNTQRQIHKGKTYTEANTQRQFFCDSTPLSLPMLQINEFRLGQLSARKILVTIDFQKLGFPNFNFLGGVAIANKQKYK